MLLSETKALFAQKREREKHKTMFTKEQSQTEDGELQFALPRQPSCENTATCDALRLARWDAANGART